VTALTHHIMRTFSARIALWAALLAACANCTGAPSARPSAAGLRTEPTPPSRSVEPAREAVSESERELESEVELAGPIEQPPAARYELGALPDGFGEVVWPAAPRIERQVELAGGERVIDRAGTRVVVGGPIERIVVRADDVEIRGSSSARVEHVLIERGRRRVRVAGGRFGTIELHVPAQHVPPPPSWRSEWMVEDVTIDGVEIEAADTAFLVRGRRIAILRSHVTAARYSVWCGDTEDLQTEELVLAGNRFTSAGPESTVRLVSVRRAVVVDNVLSNTLKHDFRVHGESDEVVFARNQLLNTGIMVGSMEGDRIGSVWILDNALHHRAPSLIEVPRERVRRLIARGNRVFSDEWDCFVCGRARSGWQVVDNVVSPYRPPPPSGSASGPR
jgi:hypothetical protein